MFLLLLSVNSYLRIQFIVHHVEKKFEINDYKITKRRTYFLNVGIICWYVNQSTFPSDVTVMVYILGKFVVVYFRKINKTVEIRIGITLNTSRDEDKKKNSSPSRLVRMRLYSLLLESHHCA